MSTPKRLMASLLVFAAIGALLACGSNTVHDPGQNIIHIVPPENASGLAYSDPSGTGYRLLRDGSSTATHLIFNLVAPMGASSKGVGFTLTADSQKVSFSKVSPTDSELVQNVAFQSAALARGVAQGNKLLVGIAKTDGAAITYSSSGSTVLKVALDFRTDVKIPKGTAIGLSISNDAQSISSAGTSLEAMGAVAVGALTAQ